MSSRWTIARIAGIPITTGWSTLFVAGLISWSLATGVIPWAAPDASSNQAWIGGLLGALLFLGSLLAHELGHALAARHRGIEVDEVSLWVFGGVATLRTEPRTPGDEAAVAAAGPAVSAVIAVVGLIAAIPAAALDLPMTAAVLGWLGVSNGMLAVFNLLPGLPLDGGRLVHAALWARSGDRWASMARAAQAGRAVGASLIGIGLLSFAIGSVGGVWTALVGWFVMGSATRIRRSAKLQLHLGDATVREVMRSVPATVSWTRPVADVIASAARGSGRFVLVTGPEGWVIGLIDVERLRMLPPTTLASLSAGQVAVGAGQPQLPFADAGDRLGDALDRSTSGSLLAVHGGRVVGLVSPDDALRAAEHRRLIDLADRLGHPDRGHDPTDSTESDANMAGAR